MKQIEIKVLNADVIQQSAKMAAFAARLTQRADKISSMEDLLNIYDRPYKDLFISNLCEMPHPTLQKLSVINVAIVGASRRFLAQITRHQNEVKFVSGSLQYSDYSSDDNKTDFVIPYSYLDTPMEKDYIESCKTAFNTYSKLVQDGKNENVDDFNDAAGYVMPQGLRNVLVISATPYQWKHMIGQRICNRNTKETQYVMLKIWEQLRELDPVLFAHVDWGCFGGRCLEKANMKCGKPYTPDTTPEEILKLRFPKLYE